MTHIIFFLAINPANIANYNHSDKDTGDEKKKYTQKLTYTQIRQHLRAKMTIKEKMEAKTTLCFILLYLPNPVFFKT